MLPLLLDIWIILIHPSGLNLDAILNLVCMDMMQSRSVRILAKTLSAGYCSFVIKICIIYQVLVILMLRIVSLEKFGPGVTNPF